MSAIRRLLIDRGLDGVTMRRIAEMSGHAVQTIYNLVGPHDQAVISSLSEYTRFVGRSADHDPRDPMALLTISDGWLRSIAAAPEFSRRISLILFTDSRDIYFQFRDRETRAMRAMLARQQKMGLVRPDVDVGDMADQVVLHSSALCLEWADGHLPFETLRHRMANAISSLISDKLSAPISLPSLWDDRLSPETKKPEHHAGRL